MTMDVKFLIFSWQCRMTKVSITNQKDPWNEILILEFWDRGPNGVL